MKIILNGQDTTLTANITLAALISQVCQHPQHVIAEVNAHIVKSEQWLTHLLNDGDAVELITFVGGG